MSFSSSKSSLAATLLVTMASLVAGCGGGGNESGPPDELVASPEQFTVKGPDKVTCASGVGPTVTIYGGTPPYTLSNSVPRGMQLSVNEIRDSGGSFTVTFNGSCMDNMPVTAEDDMGRLVSVFVTNTVADQ